jgi:hypothetical protein
MYIVTSKPKRISVNSGLVHIIFSRKMIEFMVTGRSQRTGFLLSHLSFRRDGTPPALHIPTLHSNNLRLAAKQPVSPQTLSATALIGPHRKITNWIS